MNTAKKFYKKDNRKTCLINARSLGISESLSNKDLPKAIKEWLTSLPEDSLANRFQPLVYVEHKKIQETCGLARKKPFGSFSHGFSSLRTSPTCSLLPTHNQYSDHWPKWGMMRNGVCYQQKILVPTLKGIEYGFLLRKTGLPSISSASGFRTGSGMPVFEKMLANMYSPEIARILVSSPHKTNPMVFEYLMGWPIGWTSLNTVEKIVIPKWNDNNLLKISPLKQVKYQRERIQAIGNGQVPLCVYAFLSNFLEGVL